MEKALNELAVTQGYSIVTKNHPTSSVVVTIRYITNVT